MGRVSSHFWGKPGTRLGWWSVGLGALFVALFLAVSNDFIYFSGRLTITPGMAAGILNICALIFKGERSWVVWLMFLPGAFAILFALGEILSPH